MRSAVRGTIAFCITICAVQTSAQPAPQKAQWVEFHSFHYAGKDPVAEEHPLPRDSYFNPILAGFYADPSVARVGDTFYLVNSSFSYFPGVPIFASKDLVHWNQLGHVLDRPEQLPLHGGVSRGIFAPTIRYHDGTFYMITTLIDTTGNFYVTATNPAGPWSDPKPLPQVNGIDPSFFFDADGNAYIVYNGPPPNNISLYDGHRAIWEVRFDTASGKVTGTPKLLINGGVDITRKPSWIEGPHLLTRNGFYYLIAAEGGTADQHSEVVFRSRSVEGPFVPFDGNPILSQRGLPADRPNPVTSTGHADFVEASNGQWWAVFLGCRPYSAHLYNIGRETFLLPVTWKNDWPEILPAGEAVPRIVTKANLEAKSNAPPMAASFSSNDSFDQDVLAPHWQGLRTPSSTWWKLAHGLWLQPRVKDLQGNSDPSFLGRRQQHSNFEAGTTLSTQSVEDATDAGLVAFQSEKDSFFLAAHIDKGCAQKIFLETTNEGVVTRSESTWTPKTKCTRDLDLKVTGDGADYSFYAREKGGKWLPVTLHADGSILSTAHAGGFVGTYLGMYARLSSPK